MIVRPIVRVLGAAAVALFALAHGSQAQQRPTQPPQAPPQAEQPKQVSPAAIALATQLLELKGAIGAFDAAIEGVVTHNKGNLLQINPNLTRDIDATAQTLRADAAARRQELRSEIARGYASVFTEQDLKDLIEFYKTPLGKKIIDSEPQAVEESTKRAQVWIDKYAEDVIEKMRAEMRKKGHTSF
jgi:uncharacterized protein